MAGAWRLRASRPWDVAAMARVYRDSIRCLGADHYSAAQLAAWSALGDEGPAFRAWAAGAINLVAVDAVGRCAGFAGLQLPGRIASLFVAPHATRRGVATALAAALLRQPALAGQREVRAEASALSLPLFEKLGFRVLGEEHTRVRGVAFSRHVMCLERPSA